MHNHTVVYSSPRQLNAELYSDLQSALRADPCLRDRLSRICLSDWCNVVLDLVWPGHLSVAQAARVLGVGTMVRLADRLPPGVPVEECLVPEGLAEAVGEHLLGEALYHLRDARDYLDTRCVRFTPERAGDQADVFSTLRRNGELRDWLRRRFASGWMAVMVELVYARRELTYSGFARWLGEQLVIHLDYRLPIGVSPRDLTHPGGFAECVGIVIANELMRTLRDALCRLP